MFSSLEFTFFEISLSLLLEFDCKFIVSMCMGRTNFDVTTGLLQNQWLFTRSLLQHCRPSFTYNIAIPQQTIVFTQIVVGTSYSELPGSENNVDFAIGPQ